MVRKIIFWILGILILAAAGIFAGGYYLRSKWKPLLEEQLKAAVLKSSDSLYRIQYKSLDINPATGNLRLKEFKLIPDMEVYNRLVAEKKAPDNLYNLAVDALIIRDANARDAVTSKKLNIKNIIIDHPQLAIINNRQSYNDTVTTPKKKKTPYELIKDVFKEVKIEHIGLKDIDFTYINKSNKLERKTSLKNLNIDITDLLVDSLSHEDKSRIYYTRDVAINLDNYQLATPDSLYFIKLDNLNFSIKNNKLLIKQFRLQPRLSFAKFYRKVRYAKDRFDLNFNEITLNDIDFNKFLTQQKLYAGTVNIKKAYVAVSNNNAYPRRLSNKTGRFPHQQLLKVALDMRISKINMGDIDLSYAEFDAKTRQIGKIDFRKVNGTLYNVTNDSAALSKNGVMLAKVKTSVFGVAPLSLNIKFYMKSKTGAFDYSGVVGSFNGTALNRIVRPLGMAEINTVDIKRLAFNVKANQQIATGSMQFYYNNLNVNILKKQADGSLSKLNFASKVANAVIIHTDNPNEKGVFTPGRIYYKRPATMSFFAFMWQGLFTGIKESVGVSREREARLKQNAEQVGTAVKNISGAYKGILERMQQKKKERKERKLERKKQKDLEKNPN